VPGDAVAAASALVGLTLMSPMMSASGIAGWNVNCSDCRGVFVQFLLNWKTASAPLTRGVLDH